MYSEQLFATNLQKLLSLNPKLKSGVDYDINLARLKRDKSNLANEWESWLEGSVQRSVQLPSFVPRSQAMAEEWEKIVEPYDFNADNLSQYVDLHDDIHLRSAMLRLRKVLLNCNVEPEDTVSPAFQGVPLLIALGTGSGAVLQMMIEKFKPYHLCILVTSWDDFISSFWMIDWTSLSKKYLGQSEYRLTLARVHNEEELLALSAKHGLLNLEHSLIYHSSAADEKLIEYAHVLRSPKKDNLIHYLGYTIDEYNMIYNSAQTLGRSPRIFRAPKERYGGSYIVCASGPSLDDQLPLIKQLSESHIIIASGSNYRSLRASGIDPDFVVLVERGMLTYTDFEKVIEEYGQSQTRLVMSSTCSVELIDLFVDVAVFFRPALTPLSVFSDYVDEILHFEGPESVNTAIALAVALGASQLALFGVDLGTSSLDKDRSRLASGSTQRVWDQKVAGNFNDYVYTNKIQLDAKLMIEYAIQSGKDSIQVYNCSDGALIKGAQPCEPAKYTIEILSHDGNSNWSSLVNDWWSNLPVYTSERLDASWSARRPRESTFRLARNLESLFLGNIAWFPSVLYRLDELFSLDVSISEQFPRRIMRSTIYKVALAITQQLYILKKYSIATQLDFGAQARSLLVEYVALLESEIYLLCDTIESF